MRDEEYEIRVEGAIPPEALAELAGLEATTEPATTLLHGTVVDEAALYGILTFLRTFGLQVVEVRRTTIPEQPGE